MFIFVHSPALLVSSLFITNVEKPYNLSRPQGEGGRGAWLLTVLEDLGSLPGTIKCFFSWAQCGWKINGTQRVKTGSFLAGMGQIARRVLDP